MIEEVHVPNLVIANALRRTILNDLPGYAAIDATFLDNTSLQTEENIAFALAWSAMDHTSAGRTGALCVSNSPSNKFFKTVRCEDIEGDNLKFVDPSAPVAKLAPGEKINLKINFSAGVGRSHSKFCRVARVSCMERDTDVSLRAFLVNENDSVIARATTCLRSQMLGIEAQGVECSREFALQTDTAAILLQHYAAEILPVQNLTIVNWFKNKLLLTCDDGDDLAEAVALVRDASQQIYNILEDIPSKVVRNIEE